MLKQPRRTHRNKPKTGPHPPHSKRAPRRSVTHQTSNLSYTRPFRTNSAKDCSTSRHVFRPTNPKHGIVGWLKKRFDSGTQGELMGESPEGHRFFEWVQPNHTASTPTHRRIEYKDGIPQPDNIHELWDAWLRHSRAEPPSPEEMDRYHLRKTRYFAKIKVNEERDNKLRLQEQLQRKLRGETQTSEDAQAVIQSMVAGMEEKMYNNQHSSTSIPSPTGPSQDQDVYTSWNPNAKRNV